MHVAMTAGCGWFYGQFCDHDDERAVDIKLAVGFSRDVF